MKTKKRYIITALLAAALIAGGALSYFKFFKYYLFGTVDEYSERSDYEQAYDMTVSWLWSDDDEHLIDFTPSRSESSVNMTNEDNDWYTQSCYAEYDDSTHRIELVKGDYGNFGYLSRPKTGKTILKGTYRFVSENEMKLYVDEEYVGEITNDEKVITLQKRVDIPMGISVPSEEDYYRNKQ